jgi:hypothetical protein
MATIVNNDQAQFVSVCFNIPLTACSRCILLSPLSFLQWAIIKQPFVNQNLCSFSHSR